MVGRIVENIAKYYVTEALRTSHNKITLTLWAYRTAGSYNQVSRSCTGRVKLVLTSLKIENAWSGGIAVWKRGVRELTCSYFACQCRSLSASFLCLPSRLFQLIGASVFKESSGGLGFGAERWCRGRYKRFSVSERLQKVDKLVSDRVGTGFHPMFFNEEWVGDFAL